MAEPSDMLHRDQREYNHLIKKKKSTAMIARHFSIEMTNMGEGLVCELIRDFNGEISKSLADYLKDDFNEEMASQIRKAYFEFKKYVFGELVLLRDLNASNLLYKRMTSAEGTLIVIDGLGNNDFIPIANYLRIWAGLKVKRKWQRFEWFLYKHFGQTKTLQYILDGLVN